MRFLYQLSPWLTTSAETEIGIVPGTTIPITNEGWETGEWVTVTTSVTHGLNQAELNNASLARSSGSRSRFEMTPARVPLPYKYEPGANILPGIFVAAIPFTVLVPWQIAHPRLAQALHVSEVVVPILLLLGVGTGAAVCLAAAETVVRAAGEMTSLVQAEG